jgi:hypothetical protein
VTIQSGNDGSNDKAQGARRKAEGERTCAAAREFILHP